MKTKQKNRVLFVGLLLLFLIAYQFAFKKTFDLKRELTKQVTQKEQMLVSQEKLQIRHQENRYLDSILSSNDLSVDLSFEQTLLDKIDRLRKEHKVRLRSINEPHYFLADGATIESYTIELTGDFRNLMLFSSDLEKLRLGSFSSVDFSKKKNMKTRKQEIICQILLQRLGK